MKSWSLYECNSLVGFVFCGWLLGSGLESRLCFVVVQLLGSCVC